jgi:hypothetical protein
MCHADAAESLIAGGRGFAYHHPEIPEMDTPASIEKLGHEQDV